MKVLIINPAYPKKTIGFKNLLVLEPLALLYMGAIIKNQHNVRLLDMVVDPNINRELESFRPDVVCVSAFFVHRDSVVALFDTIKAFNPSITTILGGSHVNLYPEQYKKNSIDILALGDDLYLIERILDGLRTQELHVVNDIHYQYEGIWHENERSHKIVSIDDLPFPDRSLIERYKKKYFWYFHKNIASVWGSVGCPFKCYYCTQWTKNGGHFIARSPESLVSEIEQIQEDTVFIIDDNTFTNAERAHRIYELIKERKIKKQFVCYCSSNLIIKNEKIVREWAEVGLVKVMIGFESLRTKDLSDVNNKTSLEKNDKAIKILHDIGLDTMAGFIVYPDFTKDDFKALHKYVKRRKLYYIEFTSLTPFPGTKFFDECEQHVKENSPAIFDMQHMLLKSKLPLKQYYRNVAWLYLCSYMPWRARAAKLRFKISKNPFNPIYRRFTKMVWSSLFAYKHQNQNITGGNHGDNQ